VFDNQSVAILIYKEFPRSLKPNKASDKKRKKAGRCLFRLYSEIAYISLGKWHNRIDLKHLLRFVQVIHHASEYLGPAAIFWDEAGGRGAVPPVLSAEPYSAAEQDARSTSRYRRQCNEKSHPAH